MSERFRTFLGDDKLRGSASIIINDTVEAKFEVCGESKADFVSCLGDLLAKTKKREFVKSKLVFCENILCLNHII